MEALVLGRYTHTSRFEDVRTNKTQAGDLHVFCTKRNPDSPSAWDLIEHNEQPLREFLGEDTHIHTQRRS